MRAMILAAGLGTRLRPLTEELPKPLLWVGDRRMLDHVAASLAAGGVREAVLNTHHLAAAFRPEVLEALPLALRVVHEPSILGTAGGLAGAAPLLGEGDVLVWNGDILAEVDLPALLAAHRAGGAGATLAVAPRPAGEGTVGLDARGDVVRLRGERFGAEVAGGDFIGVHVLGEAIRRGLPATGCLAGDVYLPVLRAGGRVATAPVAGAWDDIGALADYLAANRRWLARAGLSSYRGPGATVAPGVDISGSVVGAGAEVRGHGALAGSVVWPGAAATAPLAGTVATPAGRLVRSAAGDALAPSSA